MLLSIFKKCFVQTFRVPGRTRWVSFTNYPRPTPSDWIFSYQSWFFSNFKTSTSKLISHQGNFDIFFLTKEEDDAFRLIFRFWATLLLLRPLMTQRSLCGNFTFLSIFRGSWPPYSFLASILSSAECQIKLSPFSLMHSYLIRTLAKKPDKYQLCPLY